MRFDIALERLSRLPDPLPPPRSDIEARILTEGLLPERQRRVPSGPAREAAALVLLYPDASGEACIVLTVRPDGDDVHAGQVALPGGKREPGDEFPTGTALREAAEEVGLDAAAADVSVVGSLDDVDVRVSGYLLVPVLAVAEREPRLVPTCSEVAAHPARARPPLPARRPRRDRRGGARRVAIALRRLSRRRSSRLGRDGSRACAARRRPGAPERRLWAAGAVRTCPEPRGQRVAPVPGSPSTQSCSSGAVARPGRPRGGLRRLE